MKRRKGKGARRKLEARDELRLVVRGGSGRGRKGGVKRREMVQGREGGIKRREEKDPGRQE